MIYPLIAWWIFPVRYVTNYQRVMDLAGSYWILRDNAGEQKEAGDRSKMGRR